jgi:hypothetical protein
MATKLFISPDTAFAATFLAILELIDQAPGPFDEQKVSQEPIRLARL